MIIKTCEAWSKSSYGLWEILLKNHSPKCQRNAWSCLEWQKMCQLPPLKDQDHVFTCNNRAKSELHTINRSPPRWWQIQVTCLHEKASAKCFWSLEVSNHLKLHAKVKKMSTVHDFTHLRVAHIYRTKALFDLDSAKFDLDKNSGTKENSQPFWEACDFGRKPKLIQKHNSLTLYETCHPEKFYKVLQSPRKIQCQCFCYRQLNNTDHDVSN